MTLKRKKIKPVKKKGSKKSKELKGKAIILPPWRPKAYTPETLWEIFKDYAQWIKDNPLKEDKGFAYQGVVTHNDFCKMRIMTIEGFSIHADIVTSTFYEYCKKEDFSNTCNRIKESIHSQSVEGAAAGLLDPMIVVRKLGLSEKTEVTGKDGKDLIPEKVTKVEITHVTK